MFSEVRFVEQTEGASRGARPSYSLKVAAGSDALRKKARDVTQSRMKRLIDILGAGIGLILLAPLMLLVALAVRLDCPGPVLFRQSRYGLDKVRFEILKFGSMSVTESTGAFMQAQKGDPRITRIGAFLRRTSLDELPQLWNVLRGDMSLVGPRPHATSMDDTYARTIPGYVDRHLVRPGLTGLAQINGMRGPTDTESAISGRIAYDRIYIRSWSLASDLRIIILTPLRLLSDRAF